MCMFICKVWSHFVKSYSKTWLLFNICTIQTKNKLKKSLAKNLVSQFMIFWAKTKLCTNTYKLFLLAHGSATGEFSYLGFHTNQFHRMDEHIVLLTYSLQCLCNPCSQVAVRCKKHLFQVDINQLKPTRSISLTAERLYGKWCDNESLTVFILHLHSYRELW